MLLTQLFYIGSNILPTHTHSPPASPAQSSGYSGKICLFLGFSHVQMALSAPAPSSFISEIGGITGSSIFPQSYSAHALG